MHFRQAILIADQQTYQLTPGKSNSFEALFADFQSQPVSIPESVATGLQYSIFLHPKQDITVQRLEIQFDMPLSEAAHFFANGYQSWSETRWLPVGGQIPRLRALARRYMGWYGDEMLPGIPHGAGYLHSWTYTLLRDTSPEVTFLGSLNESTGFTLFLYDRPNGILTVRKDLEGLQLSHSFPALDFVVLNAPEIVAYDAYFQLLGVQPPTAPPAIGWTSWYRHFTAITEPVLMQNLESFADFCAKTGHLGYAETLSPLHEKQPVYFQIDDGWQTAVGDWLSVKPTFPGGMGKMATRIREKHLIPGIWLAPFITASNSEIAKTHPDWLLKDSQNKPLRVGWNPMWGGWYYALDFYHTGVQAYLAGVFHMVCEKWGFDLLKLDFLFAVCLAPPAGKTRGQVMHEAMLFLRNLAAGKRILACGVPLGTSFGLVDYCRIGGDIHLKWEHRLLAFLCHRERVSTIASLRSTLHRWPLNGRAFHNDPDVFILRSDHQHLSPVQQQTVLVINVLLGNLLFTSDDVGEYTPEQSSEFMEALALRGSRILAVTELENDLYCIHFEYHSERYSAYCNLNGSRRNLQPKNVPAMELSAYETIILTAPQK